MSNVLRDLPLVRWASRFQRGTVEFTGVLQLPFDEDIAGRRVRIGCGPVAGRLEFIGGPRPAVLAAAVDGPDLHLDAVAGHTLAAGPEHATVDDHAIPLPRMDLLLDALLDHLHDLAVEAEAHTDRDLIVKLSHGVEATLPADEVVSVRGSTFGPPAQPLLDAPLVVTVGGTGVRVSHRRMQWLSSLARLSLQEATLHPDGKVALQAQGRGGLQRVGGGLQRVSDRLSEVVRRSPRFARVRAFLRE